jgi:MinD superfamily P-loop ATPase
MEGERIVFGEQCECCLACMHSCPRKTINYGGRTAGKKRYINPNINLEDMKKYRR